MAYLYRNFRDGDEVALENLLKNTFSSFREGNLWIWKYRLNPDFQRSLVVLSEIDGQIVGCNYWMVRQLKLTNDVQVKVALGADVAVHPKHRGQGIGTELMRYPRLSGAFKEKGILMSYMFGRPELSNRFYKPAAGYITAPNCTITYKKLFNCSQLKEKFQQVDQGIRSNAELTKKLPELTMTISFKIKGAPEFAVSVNPDGVNFYEGKLKNTDVIIEGALPLSFLIIGGTGNTWDLARAFLVGRVKITKGVLHIFRLRKIFHLFKKAISQKV